MLIWADNAISNITDFINNTRDSTKESAKVYMKTLIDFVGILNIMPRIGKRVEYNVGNYELRQIIYKRHRIIYFLDSNKIIIIAVLHIRLNLEIALRILKNKDLL